MFIALFFGKPNLIKSFPDSLFPMIILKMIHNNELQQTKKAYLAHCNIFEYVSGNFLKVLE